MIQSQIAKNIDTVAFAAYLSSGVDNATGDDTLYNPICDTVTVNKGSGYNGGTGIFTAPVAGNYFFGVSFFLGGLAAGHTQHKVYITSTGLEYAYQDNFSSNPFIAYRNIPFYALMALAKGDTCKPGVQIYNSTKVVDLLAVETKFFGILMAKP